MKETFSSFLCAIAVLLVLCPQILDMKTVLAQGGALIDVYTQKEPFDGRGLNQPSDAFAPDEKAILYANVTYNSAPVEEIIVVFYINGPINPISNITAILTGVTNASGVATAEFTIPASPQNLETVVFGTWTVEAVALVGSNTITDRLNFQAGWLIEITSSVTLKQNLQPQSTFMRGTNLTVELDIKNIAMTNKTVTLVLNAYDSANQQIAAQSISSFEIEPGQSHTSFISVQITDWAKVGDAVAYAQALTALPSQGGAPYCPQFSTPFKITFFVDLNRDGIIDIKDIAIAAKAFGAYPEHSRWNPIADVNSDNEVDLEDLLIIAKLFGMDP